MKKLLWILVVLAIPLFYVMAFADNGNGITFTIPAKLSMVISALAPLVLSFMMKFVKSRIARKIIGYGVSMAIGYAGAKMSGYGGTDMFALMAATAGIGYLSYKKWFHGLDLIEGKASTK